VPQWVRDIRTAADASRYRTNRQAFGSTSLHTSAGGNTSTTYIHIPYIRESNPHPSYSFRGLKNQMRIRIECGLDSRSRAGFWKTDRAGVRTVRTIQLFIILFIILYNIRVLKYL
jgi:hypothetical protein